MLRNKRMLEYSRMSFGQRQILIEGFDEIRKCSDGEKYCLENYRPLSKLDILRTLFQIKKEAEFLIDVVNDMKIGKTKDVDISDSWDKRRIFWERVEKFKEGESNNLAKSIEEKGDIVEDSIAILRGEK